MRRLPSPVPIASLALAAALLALAPAPSQARDAAPATVPRHDAATFFDTTSVFGASFSHDESKVLYTSDESGVFNARAMPITGGESTALTASTTDGHLSAGYFPRDDRLLVRADRGGNERTHLFVRELDGTLKDLTPGENVRAQFLGWNENDQDFYIATNERDPQYMDVYRYRAGAARPATEPGGRVVRHTRDLVANNPGGYSMSGLSRDGRWLVMQKVNSNKDGDLYLWDLKHPASTPDKFTTHEGDASYRFMAFGPDSRALYYTSDRGSEWARLWSFNLGTKTHVLVADEPWDVSGITLSRDGRWRLLSINADARTTVRLHDLKAGKDVPLPKVPAGQIRGATFSRSGRYLAFYVNSDRTPSNLYVADLQSGGTRRLTDTLNPKIDAAYLVDGQVIRYLSFDGLEIPAILYRPHGASKTARAPAVVFVHGGPGGQSRTGYRAMFQHLLNHGYAVLAVNNRGSSGYGKTFFHLDDRRHGDVDLKDCLAARSFLETLDWVDAKRIGIMGGSYGGYMVAAALAFAPEAFDVGINIFGVTNWLRTLKSIPAWWSSFRKSLYDEIGDPATDAERLKRYSPLLHADKIRRPLLVVQGANDPRVLQAESDDLVAAVRQNGVPVEYLLFPDEGHGFRRKANRVRASEAYLAFLEKHLRGAPPPAAGREKSDDALAQKIAAQVEPYIEAERLMGLVVGVVDRGASHVYGFGRTGKDDARVPDEQTVYEIGSVSKVFTGVLLASLVEEGVLSLDQEVGTLLPKGVTLKPYGKRPLTLRGLTTHSSGLPRMPANFQPEDPGNPYADYTAEQMYAALNDHAHRKESGTAYAYSNLGTGLLGHLLTLETGKSYEALLAERITKPLGMRDTALALSHEMGKRLAPPYDADGGVQKNWDLGVFAGAGGIRSTTEDMLRFAAANLEGGARPIDRALARSQIEQFKDPTSGVRLGYGWHIGASAHWHNGQTGGYHSFLAVDRKHRFAVVLLSNTASGLIDEIGNRIGRVLAGKEVPPPEVQKLIEVDPKVLGAYAGRYELVPGFILTVSVEDGRLMVQATGQPKLRVHPESDTRFVYRAVKAAITFERDADGRVTQLVLDQNGRQMPARRLAD